MNNKRRNYFIDRKFQMEFILKFCSVVIVGCLFFGVILYVLSTKTLTTSFENSRLVVKSTASYLFPGLLFGGLIVALVTAMVSSIIVMFLTHRIAGPIYRFQRHLDDVGKGDLSRDLRIRRNDQFQSIVNSMNKMTHSLYTGVLGVCEVSSRLDSSIENLSDISDKKPASKADIEKVVSDLRRDKENLIKALSYFKLRA